MKPLHDIITEAVVSTLRFPADKIAADATNNLKQLHTLMRSAGYTKDSYRQSALEGHRYVKGDHVIEYNGWHGTGAYGGFKMGLDLFDNKTPGPDGKQYSPVFSITKIAQSAEDGEDHIDHQKRTVSATMAAEHRKFWDDVFNHVKKL